MTVWLCVCGHPNSDHAQFDHGEYCMGCSCQDYRAHKEAPLLPEGMAGHGSHRPGSVCFECERLGQPMPPPYDPLGIYRKAAPEDRSLSAGVTPEGLAEEKVDDSDD